MIPIGYMAKKIITKPDWLKVETVQDLYSVSHCQSKEFTDYIKYGKHNGFWFFDSPAIIEDLASKESIDLEGTTFFYYEVYEFEFCDANSEWISYKPDESFKTHVVIPKNRNLEGYDIVSFSAGTSPECSPLSCNSLASEINTNHHCLLESFEIAKQSLEKGYFNNSEPGPFRILSVYTLERP